MFLGLNYFEWIILFIKLGPLLAFIGFAVYYAILYVRCGELIGKEDTHV